jgi:hypothetical protein
MPSADEDPENAGDDGYEKGADKEIGRDGESRTGLAHPAEI